MLFLALSLYAYRRSYKQMSEDFDKCQNPRTRVHRRTPFRRQFIPKLTRCSMGAIGPALALISSARVALVKSHAHRRMECSDRDRFAEEYW